MGGESNNEFFIISIIIIGILVLGFRTMYEKSKGVLWVFTYVFTAIAIYFILIVVYMMSNTHLSPIGWRDKDDDTAQLLIVIAVGLTVFVWIFYAIFKDTNIGNKLLGLINPLKRKQLINRIDETKRLYDIGVYSKEEYLDKINKLKNELDNL